jgi:hypothetical protein
MMIKYWTRRLYFSLDTNCLGGRGPKKVQEKLNQRSPSAFHLRHYVGLNVTVLNEKRRRLVHGTDVKRRSPGQVIPAECDVPNRIAREFRNLDITSSRMLFVRRNDIFVAKSSWGWSSSDARRTPK